MISTKLQVEGEFSLVKVTLPGGKWYLKAVDTPDENEALDRVVDSIAAGNVMMHACLPTDEDRAIAFSKRVQDTNSNCLGIR